VRPFRTLIGESRLFRNAHIRNFLLLFSSGGGARAIQVAAYPVLLHFYAPTQFGLYAAYASIANIAAVFATMRYEMAIPLPRRDTMAAALLAVSLLSAGALCVLMLAVYGLRGRALFAQFGFADLAPYGWLAALAMLGLAFYNALTFWAIRFHAFPAIARTQMTKTAGEIGVQLGFGILGTGVIGLIIGNVVGMWLGTASLFSVGNLRQAAPRNWRRLAVAARRYRDFPVYNGVSALLSQATSRLSLLAIGAMHSLADIGLLWLAFMLLEGPASIVIASAQKIYYAMSRDIVRDAPERLRGIYLKAVGTTALLCALGLVLAYLLLPEIFEYVFPRAWAGSMALTQVLLPAYAAQIATSPFTMYSVLRRQSWNLGWNVVVTLANAAVVAAAYFYRMPILTTVLLLACVRVLYYGATVPIQLAILPGARKPAAQPLPDN
jgi:O-antigen/teichoic acid export membrane protein